MIPISHITLSPLSMPAIILILMVAREKMKLSVYLEKVRFLTEAVAKISTHIWRDTTVVGLGCYCSEGSTRSNTTHQSLGLSNDRR